MGVSTRQPEERRIARWVRPIRNCSDLKAARSISTTLSKILFHDVRIDQVAFGLDEASSNGMKLPKSTLLNVTDWPAEARPVTIPGTGFSLWKIEKTVKNRAFRRFSHFTSFAWFRMIVTTRDRTNASEPYKYRVPTRLRGSRQSLTGGLMATQRMTQTQLVRGLAEAGEVTNKQSRAMLDTLSSLAISEVKKNGVFVLPGIGRLVRVDRKARLGRNPATGEAIKIPAKKVVKFESRKRRRMQSFRRR